MSTDELVDIVDEKGDFLEVVSKKEAHEKGLLHTCVITEVINSRGEWLMVKPIVGRQDAGQYISPVGGHVSSGETELEAIKRETSEEIGLTGDYRYKFVGKKILNRFVVGRQENHFLSVYKMFSDQEPVLGEEDESYKYFTEEELKRELKQNPKSFGDAFHFVVKEFFPNLL